MQCKQQTNPKCMPMENVFEMNLLRGDDEHGEGHLKLNIFSMLPNARKSFKAPL